MKPRKTYRPLPDELTIRKSKVNGLGLFAVEDIPKGRTFGPSHYNLRGYEGLGLIRTPLGGFINHNPKPNCRIITSSSFWSIKIIKKIAKGEELTLKYGTYKILNPNF
jgi:SET domain-containing protein